MAEKNIIGCCDTTDHGGRVLEGYALMRLDNGHRVAGKGHMVFCPQCNGIFPIEGGVPSLFGYAPAVEGMRTTCGARLIASQNRETLDDEADAATNQRSAPALSESTNTAPISAPPAGTGVSSAAFAVTRPPAEDPVHVVIRIALCDDGTGNNYPNSKAAIEKCSPQAAGLDKHPAIIDQLMAACRKQNNMNDVSYAGGETNVHRLHDLYPEMYRLDETVIGQDGRRYVYLRAYIEGIGTRADHKDSLFTFGTGFGPTGVIACAEKAVEAAVAQISRFLAMNPNIIIDATEFDLFGFSRGAASSRHVVSLILHGGDQGVMARQLREAGLPLKDGWSGGNKSDLRIRFVGLYESVAAIGIPDNGNNDPVKLHLSDDCADHVVHLTARDECRENFCLNRVKLSRYIEIALPGVHSDLGGGYSMLGWEQSVLTRPEISLENLDQEKYDFATSRELKEMLKVYLDKVATGSTAVKRTLDQLREAEKLDKDWLIDSELNPPPNSHNWKMQTWTKVVAGRRQTFRGPVSETKLQVAAALVALRQVRGEYQLITLRIMHALAVRAGVPLKDIPPDPALAVPKELLPIYDKLLAYALNDGKGEIPLTRKEEQWLSRRYLHQSANWNPGGWPTTYDNQTKPNTVVATLPTAWGADLGVLFPMRPADERDRLTYFQKKGH